MAEITEERKGEDRRTFAIILRGRPDDFAWLVAEAKLAGLYVVFTKTSYMKLEIQEVPW